ncbi:MbtH family protein [Streptomyces sp. NPDC050842]|uniref:MbtH family protein n=1 Tax=Streptomyces sp. NPDC050842 TaxID=3365636 RepID=UPI0037BBF312
MSGPFDDESALFSVLVNAQGQYSLWPAAAPVPGGWTVALPPADRATALGYVNEHWSDLRPRALARRLRTN